MSWQASSWALKQRVGDPILKILLLAAANYADPDGRCWPKVETLAFYSEVSKRTIQRKLVELQELGLIRLSARFNEAGKQVSSTIELLMEEEGCQKVTPGICHGEGDTTLSPTDSLNNQKNKQLRPAKQQDGVYGEEFEELWKLAAQLGAPRTRNTSKKKAHDLWRMLNTENQAKVRAAIPAFAAAMKAEGRPEDKIKHFQFFLSERVYETVGAAPAAAKQASADWYKTATREQWQRLLPIWRGDMNWRLAWGPAPGKPGCGVPGDLLTDDEKSLGSSNRVAGRSAA